MDSPAGARPSKRPFLSIVPFTRPSADVTVAEVEERLRHATGILLPVARTLANGSSISLSARRAHAEALRRDVQDLRAKLTELLEGEVAPLSMEPDAPFSQERPTETRVARREEGTSALQLALFETLLDAVDVSRLVSTVALCPKLVETVAIATARAQLDLIADLLDVCVMEDGKAAKPTGRVNLVQLGEHVTRACWSAARHRRVTVLVTVGATTGQGDADLLRRALTTLVHEAILSMPAHSTLTLDISGEGATSLNLSFTGSFRASSPSSPMGGLELAFCGAAVRAHGASLATTETDGRTHVDLTLPGRLAASRLRRCA